MCFLFLNLSLGIVLQILEHLNTCKLSECVRISQFITHILRLCYITIAFNNYGVSYLYSIENDMGVNYLEKIDINIKVFSRENTQNTAYHSIKTSRVLPASVRQT